MTDVYDCIIVGGGPGGLTAGIYARYFRMKFLVFDDLEQPSQLAYASKVSNYPGIESIAGGELIERMKKQLEALGGERRTEKVRAIKIENGNKVVYTDKDKYEARTVILSTGSVHRHAGIKGEEELIGKGVSYCATCDGIFHVGKHVVVVGGGDTALTYASYLKGIGCNVTLVHRRDEFRAMKENVEEAEKAGVNFKLGLNVKEIIGKDMVEKVLLDNGEELQCSAVFIAAGMIPMTGILKDVGTKVDDSGFVIVDDKMQTSVEGIFSVGDMTTTPFRQITVANGQATIAVFYANKYLKK